MGIDECRVDCSTLNADDWNRIFRFGIRHNISALLCDGIEHKGDCRIDKKSLLRFGSERMRIAQQSQHMQKAIVALLSFFNGQGIRTMILKGGYLASCYPVPSHRSFADIDIYQFGDFRKADKQISSEFGIKICRDSHHHTKYSFNGVTIENHYDFVNVHTPRSNREYEHMLKSCLSDIRHSKIGGESVCLPSATFEALFYMRHMSNHFATSRITLRDLCDWRMFLHRRSQDVDWQFVANQYQQYGMMPFVGALHGILEDHLALLPMPMLPRTGDAILQESVLNDILADDLDEHKAENLSRIAWKISRRRSNRWKYSITYSDSWHSIQMSSIMAHLAKPRSIMHKV